MSKPSAKRTNKAREFQLWILWDVDADKPYTENGSPVFYIDYISAMRHDTGITETEIAAVKYERGY